MKVTILGCGSSAGVPLIGCECEICRSDNPKNHRTRSSILVEHQDTTLLVDSSPDLRQQALVNRIVHIDALLYTHAHADHTHGIDELRSFNFHRNSPLDCYGDQATFDELQQRFDYAFKTPVPEYGWFRPALNPHVIKAGDVFTVGDIEVQSFPQRHGKVDTLGFRFGDIAYSTDVNVLGDEAFAALEGVKIWIVDCLRYEKVPTHAHLDLTLGWIERVKPQRAILTHMNHEMEYETLKRTLPQGVIPAYDNMVVDNIIK